MPMVVQHNMSAINANNKMNVNVAGLKKSTEKLSSGYQINRAGDNAAGLAISEKMRSQIRGLSQATKNAQDGISLIQTAEGGLNETHSILQRMRELAVQSANGTYTESDRKAIQLEADALKDEIDRISTSTEYNTQQLLDGSLSGGGKVTEYGALYGMIEDGVAVGGGQITTTSSIAGVSIAFTTGASGKGGENAVWDEAGTTLTINLVEGRSYKDDEIQKLIDEATVDKANTNNIPKLTFKSEYGVIQGAEGNTTATVAGVRQIMEGDLSTLVANGATGGIGSSDTIKLTANTYGAKEQYLDSVITKLTIATDVAAGKESITVKTDAAAGTNEVQLHLATGVEYSEKDIENLLKSEGFDYTVELTDTNHPDGAKNGSVYFNKKAEIVDAAAGGAPAGPSAEKVALDKATALAAALKGAAFNTNASATGNVAAATWDPTDATTGAGPTYTDTDGTTKHLTQADMTAFVAGMTATDAATLATEADAKVKAAQDAFDAANAGAPAAAVDLAETTAGAGVGKESVGSVGEGLTFQIGANGVEDQRVTLNIDDMSAGALGVDKVDVSDRDKANEAIDVIDAAIEKVSMQRAGLGALQNRLEYTVNNLTTTNENLTNAESTIRDTDMATEMISYTKFNILQQASQAMLAQANQQPQAVLQLLG